MGAVDAWHAALTELEDLKLEGIPFCGGVVDIARFLDQIIRDVVYTSAAYAGMPRNILAAYKDYIENLKLYNCIAGGVGTPHRRRWGIPQGCPFSMMMVALIKPPWVVLMGVLGPDVAFWRMTSLSSQKDPFMFILLARAINFTHKYLQTMGARLAPDKSYNFTSTPTAEKWLRETW